MELIKNVVLRNATMASVSDPTKQVAIGDQPNVWIPLIPVGQRTHLTGA
jgi:hypothetical protein